MGDHAVLGHRVECVPPLHVTRPLTAAVGLCFLTHSLLP